MKKNILKGLLLALILAIPAELLGQKFPIIGGPVFGILIGIVLAGIHRPTAFEAGIAFTGKKVLQYSIILLGFEMNLYNVMATGSSSLAVMLTTLATSFVAALLFGKLMKLDFNTTLLIGGGTAICGGSAIAAIAPVIGAKDKEITFSISTIFLFNIAAVFIFPALGHYFNFTDSGFGMWAGTAINDTSSVVAAGYSYSEAAGGYATIVKLTRALMIVPVCLILSVVMAKRNSTGDAADFNLKKIFPNFILWFVVASIVSTFIMPEQLKDFYHILGNAGKFCIVMAMTAIGLNTNIFQLINNGGRPILLGFICWVAVAAMSLIMQFALGLI